MLPISKVDKNMQTAQKRDACCTEKIWFRKNVRKIQRLSNGFAQYSQFYGDSSNGLNGCGANTKVNGLNENDTKWG